MNTNAVTIEKENMKRKLQTLWIFLMFNYLYCDFLTNMDSGVLKGLLSGTIGSIQINQGYLLGAALLMEVPIAMVLLSQLLTYKANRWANMIAGVIMAIVQVASLFIGAGLTLHYVFYSAIEITCALFVVGFSIKWRSE